MILNVKSQFARVEQSATAINTATSGRIALEGTMISGDLGQKLEAFVAELVASGRYNPTTEVLREGIRLIQERETRLTVLDQALARGLADLHEGRTTPLADVIVRLVANTRE